MADATLMVAGRRPRRTSWATGSAHRIGGMLRSGRTISLAVDSADDGDPRAVRWGGKSRGGFAKAGEGDFGSGVFSRSRGDVSHWGSAGGRGLGVWNGLGGCGR